MKIFSLIVFALALNACGENKSEYNQYYDQEQQASETEVTDLENSVPDQPQEDKASVISDAAMLEQGAKLISLSDCLACHKEEEKLVGPAYLEVAKKYEMNDKNVAYLAGKIIKGGSGVWGQVPMTPHPDISEEDAKAMASYILSLRK